MCRNELSEEVGRPLQAMGNAFAKTLTEKYGAQVKYIADIGPVIGAHDLAAAH